MDTPRSARRCSAINQRYPTSREGPVLRLQPSHSPQQLIQGDRQIADADAGGMIDGVGNCSCSPDDPDFAHPFRTYGIDVRVLLVDPGCIDGADIGVGGDAVSG